jgi:hypothetical protein
MIDQIKATATAGALKAMNDPNGTNNLVRQIKKNLDEGHTPATAIEQRNVKTALEIIALMINTP